ncbi:MAG: pyruvate, phosphate dikinase, partial [Oscillospiraceae bacterium]|nr:pyruvate, phosphate dikinase [Oscillospiraceae bacterium]
MAKFVYLFSEGDETMRELLGGKGANLAGMTKLGLPIPQGFTVSTEACTQYYTDGEKINDSIQAEIMEYVTKMEALTEKKFGDKENPLLVSVRSGSRASMPGMMDTVLNLGLNDEVVEVLANKSGNPRWAYDCYRRFIQMYSDVVMEVGKKYFEELIDEMKEKKGIELDTQLTPDDLKELCEQFKAEYKAKLGADFPTDPKAQLMGAIKAVFRSWNNERAIYYRRMHNIPGEWGTAVNVQAMVFGNLGDTSGTGVAFTRCPATGKKELMGEYLINAQGEDVVAGIRTPNTIDQLKNDLPEAYDEFVAICDKLEKHYKDMQDMEFTIEDKKLYMLQTRSGKRTAAASLKIAVDLVKEGMIDEKLAISGRLDPSQLDALLHPQFDTAALAAAKVIGKGLDASPGAACGIVALTAEKAAEWGREGKAVILVRLETSPEDIEGMDFSKGILTARGGKTSHAAVVARAMGKCCVSGCGEIKFKGEEGFELGGKFYKEGDTISLNGSTGNIYGEAIATVDAEITGDFDTVMQWADKYRTLKVRTNADTPKDAKKAVEFGAEGIGLTRTEHMFFEGDRIAAIREMICAETV